MKYEKIIVPALVILAVFMGMEFLTTRMDYQLLWGGVVAFLVLILGLWPSVNLDVKLVFIVILGYALGGKGFAYVSPYEPIYIGEIAFSICLVGYLLRFKLWFKTWNIFSTFIAVYLIYGLIRVVIDFPVYQMNAIRDSAVVYYSAFFLFSSVFFMRKENMIAFHSVIKVAIWFALVSKIIYAISDFSGFPIAFIGFQSHPDAYGPLIVGGVAYYLVKSCYQRSILSAVFALFFMLATVLVSKTSFILALFIVLFSLVVFGRARKILIPCIVGGSLSVLVTCVVLFIGPSLLFELVLDSETAETLGAGSGGVMNAGGTTGWRIGWWMMIWQDTMSTAPFLGLGFGADISSAFLIDVLGYNPSLEELASYSRYPHCVFFTVLGRMGIIGAIIFVLICVLISPFVMKFYRFVFTSSETNETDVLVMSVFVAGLFNAYVQATYEIPYGAITNWVCLGYCVARYKVLRTPIDARA
ncbi:O-antigen ligase family protein [Rubritalea marina]|uniref:O-antigen ligase family protein n=1 Tax=Rubritalea marina TaxID=361055 RepID=UPI00035D5395|nr:O-antigen ligase family protein [Rubritalea marina]